MAKICPYCGSNNTDDSKFCVTCGGNLENNNQNNVVNNVVNNDMQNGMPNNNMSNNNVNSNARDSFTTTAFVLSLVGFILCTYCGIPGLIMGIISLNKVNKGEISQSNKGFAIAAIVFGALAILIMIYNIATIDWSSLTDSISGLL